MRLLPGSWVVRMLAAFGLLVLGVQFGNAQDRIKSMPGFATYRAIRPQLKGAIKLGRLETRWIDSAHLAYRKGTKWFDFDLATQETKPLDAEPKKPTEPTKNDERKKPERGRQYTETFSANGGKRAYFENGNVWLSEADGSNPKPVTTDGDPAKKVQFGTACWVYGEELGLIEPMGFSPDGSMLWYMGMDMRPVHSYYMALSQIAVQDTLDEEAYPKAGAPNPIPELFIYHLGSGKTVKVQVRPGEFDDNLGHLVFAISWSPDGKELFFHRTDRIQSAAELCAADPATGAVRAITHVESSNSWVDTVPGRVYLDSEEGIDAKPEYKGKAVWVTEANGFRNLALLDLKTGALKPLTENEFDLVSIAKVDLAQEQVFYTATDGANPYKYQLHRVGLDGKGDVRLTDPAVCHAVTIAPDGAHFVDVAEAIDVPPTTSVRDANGELVATLATSEVGKLAELGYENPERFEFLAADGKTKLHGMMRKPAKFDRTRKYPVLLSVYAGPESGGLQERYMKPHKIADFGFIQVSIAGRGTTDRGKAFRATVYRQLGQHEIDDQAAGIRYLTTLPFVDAKRVGVHGTSYGGYASTMCILRHPDVFRAACACSSVTAWENYDSVYTERYMSTPQRNPEGYAAASAMNHAKSLQGELMIYYGTSDNNVHPSNTFQLVNALHKWGKSFRLNVAPDRGHTNMDWRQMVEFFIDALDIQKE